MKCPNCKALINDQSTVCPCCIARFWKPGVLYTKDQEMDIGGRGDQPIVIRGYNGTSGDIDPPPCPPLTDVFVSTANGNDETGDGSLEKPFKTLRQAWESGYFRPGIRINTDIKMESPFQI